MIVIISEISHDSFLFLHRNTTLDYHHLKGAHAKSWSIPTNFPQELWLAGQFLCSKQPLNETSYNFPVIDIISKCVPSCDIGNPALDFKGQDTCGVYIWISSLGLGVSSTQLLIYSTWFHYKHPLPTRVITEKFTSMGPSIFDLKDLFCFFDKIYGPSARNWWEYML